LALIVDANAMFSAADADDPAHQAVCPLLVAEREELVTSAFVAAEADYLIQRRLGVDAELAFLDDLASGAYTVESLNRDELGVARALCRQYRDLQLGLADASLVVLARRFNTRRILTLDHRAFRVIAPLQGGSFELLPG